RMNAIRASLNINSLDEKDAMIYIFNHLQRNLALIAISLSFATVSSGQNTLGGEKVLEFYGINCEAQRGYVDALLQEMRESPTLKGMIIIHGEPVDPISPYKQKGTIINHLAFRQFDLSRFIFVLGDPEIRFRTELRKISPGETHISSGDQWNFQIRELRYPVLAHMESWEEDGIGCG